MARFSTCLTFLEPESTLPVFSSTLLGAQTSTAHARHLEALELGGLFPPPGSLHAAHTEALEIHGLCAPLGSLGFLGDASGQCCKGVEFECILRWRVS
jgi:hypothetical protein